MPKQLCCSLFSFFVISMLLQSATAQDYYAYDKTFTEPTLVLDFGLAAGSINSITDIGGNTKIANGPLSSITFKTTNFATSLSLTGTYKDVIAARIDYTWGVLEGADSLLKNLNDRSAAGRAARNLSFRTPVQEMSVCLELHPLFFWNHKGKNPPALSPYLVAGIGLLKFNPQAKLDNIWVDLAPLRLEGQGFREYPERKSYKKTAYSFPVGIGVRYDILPHLFLRAEICGRKTNTDYLDDVSHSEYIDPNLFFNYLPMESAILASKLYNRSNEGNSYEIKVSTRGNPGQKDLFWTAMVKVGFIFNRKRL